MRLAFASFAQCVAGAFVALAFATAPIPAQNLFSPIVRVNDGVVTQYELDQRIALLRVLRAPGDLEKRARQGLIDERLQVEAAQRAGIDVTEQELQDGMEEFAGRADLSAEEFIRALSGSGVEETSFRDFIRAGVAWRKLIRGRFAQQARAQVTEPEIDRAIGFQNSTGGARVLLSEIFLPANTPQAAAEAQNRARGISEIKTLEGFASAARQFSAAPSRSQGGRIEWLALTNLPPLIQSQVLTLSPGEVTEPLQLPTAIALFQLRAIEEIPPEEPTNLSVDYAAFHLAGGRTEATLAEARRVEADTDTCDDLYGVADGLPADQLQRQTLPMSEIPQDVAIELAKLDPGEVSTAVTRSNGQTLMLLMLCERLDETAGEASRDEVRQDLINQRIASLAGGYLAELRAEAIISTP